MGSRMGYGESFDKHINKATGGIAAVQAVNSARSKVRLGDWVVVRGKRKIQRGAGELFQGK